MEWALIGLQVFACLALWILAMVDANDPDWGDVVRVVVTVLATIWVGGIVVSVFVARLIEGRIGRSSVLLVGPFVGFIVLIGLSFLG